MVGKKGLLKIVEASIAVLIVLGVILVVASERKVRFESDLSDVLSPILDEIAKNVSLRDKIFLDEAGAIQDMEAISSDKIKNQFLNYSVVICGNIDEFCGGLGEYPSDAKGSIYSSERIISTRLNATLYSPKKIKIYLWRIRN